MRLKTVTVLILAVACWALLSGCASILTGHKQAEQATTDALAGLDAPGAQEASERYGKLAGTFANFGVVNAQVYRGAAPDLQKLRQLREAGIVSVIDFRRDADEVAAEAAACEANGLIYHNLPWSGRDEEIGLEHVPEFLALLEDPANLPAFVHCKRGAERTGTMIAIYRIEQDGWTPEEAYREMNRYGYRSLLYGDLKKLVLEYEVGTITE